MSEKSIINTLLVVCLTLGFLCVATIYLPSKLTSAGTPDFQKFSPSRLLALLPQEKKADPQPTLAQANIDPPPGQEQLATAASLPESKERPSAYTRVNKQSSLCSNEPQKEQKKNPFAVPPELETDVAFWRDIYAKYDSHQVILHDMKFLPIVYGVMDFTDLDANTAMTDIERQREKQVRIDAKKEDIIAILEQLALEPPVDQLSDRAYEIRKMFRIVDEPDKFKRAKERGVRAQAGQKDKFIMGLQYSGRYMGEIESIFESQGLPRDLTLLIFVESMFNPSANSSAGARGIWQFMRGTAKIYGMRINSLIDDRADPIRSTYAAANLLRHDYENLGNWPLAVNAYNTGRGRMTQAVARLGTANIAPIIKYFDHPSYGFASRNFYLEFLAALDVAKNHRKYFGEVRFDPPLKYDLISVSAPISLPDVAMASGVPIEAVSEMNPSYSPSVFSGQKPFPAGSELRLPERKGELFLAYCERAPETSKFRHIVEEGETIQDIAAMYNVPASRILNENKIMGKRLHPGQELRITR